MTVFNSQLFLIHLNTYVMGLRPFEILSLLQCGDRLQLSESDVCRRQIRTTEVGPRTVRVNRDLVKEHPFKPKWFVHG